MKFVAMLFLSVGFCSITSAQISTLTVSGTITATSPDGGISHNVTGTGTATLTGYGTATLSVSGVYHYYGAPSLTFALDFGSGDVLQGSLFEDNTFFAVPQVYPPYMTFKIGPGSGRFANETGEFLLSAQTNFGCQPAIP